MKVIIYLSFVYFLLAGCQEKTPQISFDKEFSRKFIREQTYIINNSRDTSIIGLKGTIIYFPNNCFDLDTNSYEVTILLKEYFEVSDMIMDNLTTTTIDGKILETAGMINIRAMDSDGNQIKGTAKKFKVKMPGGDRQMSMFIGNQGDDGIVRWIPNSQVYVDTVPPDTLFNEFFSNKFGWINADKFMSFDNVEDLLVEVPFQEARYVAVFNNSKSLLPCTSSEAGLVKVRNLPLGEKIRVIGIGENNKDLYYSLLDFEFNGEKVSLPDFQKVTERELKELVSRVD